MSEKLGLGQLITTTQSKDAIHVAVVPVFAAQRLHPGAHVSIRNGKAITEQDIRAYVGVVDPFLCEDVQQGDCFWLYLRPGSITSLRHAWTHPAFVNDEPVDPKQVVPMTPAVRAARQWLENFSERFGVDCDELIEAAKTGNTRDVCGNDDSFNEQTREREFWRHIEVVAGVDIPEETKKSTYFRCSC